MSNAIIGIALPANVVEGVRRMLEELSRAPNELSIAYKLGELHGLIDALGRLQRLSRENCERLCQHAGDLAHKREQLLIEQGEAHGDHQ